MSGMQGLFKSAVRPYGVFRYVVAFGAAVLLAGCVGEPQTYYAAKPIVLQPRAVAQVRKKPAPAPLAPASAPNLSTPNLSTDEKQQLFQEFQASQRLKDPVAVAPRAAP